MLVIDGQINLFWWLTLGWRIGVLIDFVSPPLLLRSALKFIQAPPKVRHLFKYSKLIVFNNLVVHDCGGRNGTYDDIVVLGCDNCPGWFGFCPPCSPWLWLQRWERAGQASVFQSGASSPEPWNTTSSILPGRFGAFCEIWADVAKVCMKPDFSLLE